MSVRIRLIDGQSWYTNHDTIRGEVRLDLKQSTDVGSVTVTFAGISRTALDRVDDVGQKFTDADKEMITVISLEQQLFPPHGEQYGDKYKLGAGSHIWPFVFEVPGHSSVDVIHNSANYGLGQLMTGEKAPLPPSLSDISEDVAAIRYYLRAAANRSVVLGLGPSEVYATEPIVILPSDPSLDHIPTFGVIHSSRSRVISSAKSVSGLISRLVSTLAHDRAPVCENNVYFEVRSELLLTPGLKFSWLLEARVLKAGESVHIAAVQVVLVARTHIRAKNLDEVLEKSLVLYSRTGLDLTFGDSADVTALLHNPQLKLPDSVPPSFAFSNIKREYRLDVQIKYGHRPSSALAHKTLLSRKVYIRAGMYALPSYYTGEIIRVDRGFPQAGSYSKKIS